VGKKEEYWSEESLERWRVWNGGGFGRVRCKVDGGEWYEC
jgi:hypothetical protein